MLLIFARAIVGQRSLCQITEPKRFVQLSKDQQACIGPQLGPTELKPHASVKIDLLKAVWSRTHRVYHKSASNRALLH